MCLEGQRWTWNVMDMTVQGKTKVFAHPALKGTILEFFYTGTYYIVDKHPDLFYDLVPVPCLALMALAVLSCLQYLP